MLTAVGAHPVTECAFVDTKLLRHSGDRARRLDHHLHSFIFEFRREALLRSRQLLHLSRRPSYWTDCPEASGHPTEAPLIEHWNGRSWSLRRTHALTRLKAVLPQSLASVAALA